MAKLNDRCFCYFSAAMFASLRGVQTWRHHTKLQKFKWNTFPNNARMENLTDIKLGEVIYISIIFHISASWLNLLNGYDFYFWWRDTANQPLLLNNKSQGCFKFISLLQWNWQHPKLLSKEVHFNNNNSTISNSGIIDITPQ